MVDAAPVGEDATANAVRPSGAVAGRQIGRYLTVLALYVALAVGTLGGHHNVVVLNWIVGPLFPVISLYVIPKAVLSVASRMAHR